MALRCIAPPPSSTIHAQLLCTALALTATLPLHADPVAAQPASRFVDSIGVNVHAHGLYERHHDAVTAKLGELGVRHLRDGAQPRACAFAMDFFTAHGIKTTWITGRRVGGEKEWLSPLKPEAIDEELRDIRERALAATSAIEGPNEYDLHSDKRDPDWPATLRRYHQLVFEKVKADPALRALPVIGPSLTSEEAYKKVGDLDAWIDFTCLHHYQSTRHPGTPGWGANGYGSIDWALKYLAPRQSPSGKPVMSTECGYQPGGGDRISEQAQAKYLPRMFAEFFRRGYFRSYQYELLGNEWGLLRDDLSERPAFVALKNPIALLRDDGNAASASLDFALENAPGDMRQLLLRKSDGAFCLLLWREVPSWDVDKKRDLAPATSPVTFSCAPMRAATLHTLNAAGEMAVSKPQLAEDKTIRIDIGDTLSILHIQLVAP